MKAKAEAWVHRIDGLSRWWWAAVIGGFVVLMHGLWLRGEGYGVHGWSALAASALLCVVVHGLWVLGRHGWQEGWRSCFGRPLMARWAWNGLMAMSIVTLFYAGELWRGKRAWASMLVRAQELGEVPGRALPRLEPVSDQANAARTAVFAPLDVWVQKPGGQAEVRKSPALESLNSLWKVTQSFLNSGDAVPTDHAPWIWGQMTDLRRWQALYLDPTNRSYCHWLRTDPTSFEESGGTSWPPAMATRYALKSAPPDEARREVLNRLKAATREESAEAVLRALEPRAKELEAIAEAAQRPWARFRAPTMVGDGLWTQLRTFSGLSQVFRLRASAELELGRDAEAWDSARVALRLADYARQQPVILAHRMAHVAVLGALQPVWEGLRKRCWTTDQIQTLQDQLVSMDVLAAYRDAVRLDVVSQVHMINRIIPVWDPSSGALYRDFDPDEERVMQWVRLVYPKGWSWQVQAELHRYLYVEMMPVVDAQERRVRWPDMSPHGLVTATSDPFFPIFIVPRMREILAEALQEYPATQSALDLALVACAIEQYRLARGEWPERLEKLAPEFLKRIPSELTSNRPFVYQVGRKGDFTLYSVGADGRDDRGRRPDLDERGDVFRALRKEDCVWSLANGEG